MTVCIGLTGIIGSGKSVVAKYFIKNKITVIDTDIINKEILENPRVVKKIVRLFDKSVILRNNRLDKKKLREIVFKDDDLLKKLQSILHPLIYKSLLREVEKSKSVYTIIVVPLLFQSPSFLKMMTKTIFVDCFKYLAIQRAQKRDNIKASVVKSIINKQVSPKIQRKLATYILTNNSSIKDLEKQVNNLHKKLLISD